MKSFYPSLLLVLLFITATRPAQAQFLWQRAVGTAASDETAEYMIPVAGGFVTLGKTSTPVTYPPQRLYLTKVNYLGDTVWTKRVGFANLQGVFPRGLIVDGAGNLVVSATAVAPSTPTLPTPPSQGLLVKLTAAGDTIWSRTVRSPNGAGLTTLVLGNDGSYVAIGQLAPTLPTLFKYSPAGVLLWTQLVGYSTTVLGYLGNLVAVPNGYFIVSAPDNINLPTKYITVDESGVYQFDRLGRTNPFSSLKLDSQGNILALGGTLTKLTVQGNLVWSYAYQQYAQPLALTRLIELPNGRYLAAGERGSFAARNVGILVLDRNGTALRDTLFVRNGSDQNVAGLGLTPASNYVVALGASNGPIGRADQILFAYRNWDRLLPAATRPPAPDAQLVAYPNPTTDAVTLAAADAHPLTGQWVLYDVLGRPVQSGVLPGVARPRISLAQQPAGRYLLRVSDAQRQTTQTLRLEKH